MKVTADEKLERALLHEVDLTLQRFYHQTLRDVVQDLTIHKVLQTPDPPATTLLRTIRRTGILHMRHADQMTRMGDVLDRYVRGTLGTCTRCGRPIARKDLIHRPSILVCSRCRKKELDSDLKGMS